MNWATILLRHLCPDPDDAAGIGTVLRTGVVPASVTALGLLGRNLAQGGALWAATLEAESVGSFEAYADRGGPTHGVQAPWSPRERVPHPRYRDILGT